MSKGSSLPYRLRPNKAVDRELFLSLLVRLATTLTIERHQYISLGGAFLEDFRLIHARLGIEDMQCVESEEDIHKRQQFNRPVSCIKCIHNTLETHLDETIFEKPVIIWFDYTSPKLITEKIERFSRTILNVPIGSILRITMNANPTSLGKPPRDETACEVGGRNSRDGSNQIMLEWRLDKFRKRLGNLFPSGLEANSMLFKNYGKSILLALKFAVDKEILSAVDRRVVWSLATHYADGQAMVTATLIVCQVDNDKVEGLVKGWQFYSEPNSPLLLDMPALSTFERLFMESREDAGLGFDLPSSDMGGNPLESFKKFYRVFPHFSQVQF